MKKLHLLLLSVTLCLFSVCHNELWEAIDGLDSRVTKLEELCKEMNTNITSLQTIVDVLQSNDFITSIVEIKKNGEVIGYTITFGKHDPITIYHGQNGKDGQNGQDGQDGEDGKDGADGQDGKDGITPQLKIEDGYWYISYDNGTTWTELGRATGEDGQDGKDGADGKDGQNGTDGKDGEDGDSFFQSVTQDENYVYFTLADGTVIKISKGSGNQSSMGDGYVTSGMADGYYYVDLDLPSGTKWATCNVGSNLPEGPGYFFAWGETARKESYSESSYSLTIGALPDTIYHTEYDAATINWSTKWATPTKKQWEELVEWGNWNYTTFNDVNGWKVSGSNGNAIFLPAVGWIKYSSRDWTGYLQYSSSVRTGTSVYCLYNYKFYYKDTPPAPVNADPKIGVFTNCQYGNGSDYSSYKFEYYSGYPIRPVLVE